MTALPYYHVAARAVPAITATPCGGYPPEKILTDTLNRRRLTATGKHYTQLLKVLALALTVSRSEAVVT